MMRFLLIVTATVGIVADSQAGPLRNLFGHLGRQSQGGTCQGGSCQAKADAETIPVSFPTEYPLPMPSAPVASPTTAAGSGIAQAKAETQARAGRMFHPGGSMGSGTHEGVGFSSVSAEDAIRRCCYFGRLPVVETGVARGSNGWYACVIYR